MIFREYLNESNVILGVAEYFKTFCWFWEIERYFENEIPKSFLMFISQE